MTPEDERDHFSEHGWLVLRGAVPANQLDILRRGFDAVLGGVLRRPGLWQLPGVVASQPSLLTHLRDPALGARLATILDTPALTLLQDTLILKVPGGSSSTTITWHQDYSYTGFLTPARLMSVRVALEPETLEGGCMQVVDRSHSAGLIGELAVGSDALTEVESLLPPELAERFERDRVALELEPGDISLHHCLTLHGSLDNRSPNVRKTLVTHLFDGERCRVDPERLPEGAVAAHIPTDAEGRLTGDAFEVFGRARTVS